MELKPQVINGDPEEELKARIRLRADNIKRHAHDLALEVKSDLKAPFKPIQKARDAVSHHPLRSLALALGAGFTLAALRAPLPRAMPASAIRSGSPLLGLLGRGLLFVVRTLAESRPSQLTDTMKDFSATGALPGSRRPSAHELN